MMHKKLKYDEDFINYELIYLLRRHVCELDANIENILVIVGDFYNMNSHTLISQSLERFTDLLVRFFSQKSEDSGKSFVLNSLERIIVLLLKTSLHECISPTTEQMVKNLNSMELCSDLSTCIVVSKALSTLIKNDFQTIIQNVGGWSFVTE